ncbi:ComEC/Rec2 family competence protein [Demequina aurantiaca]|uniref:ComEC/Rec2 family competence protein n=1 Tax=Demequina aurantiaca TaxID=676200 RepID=UPI003D3313F4
MKPRHDARLVPAAIGAYACAGLATGEVLAVSQVRALVAVATWAACAATLVWVVAHVLSHRTAARLGSALAHVLLAATVAIVVTCSAVAHMNARWEGGFAEAVSGSGPVDLQAVVAREPVPLTNPGFDGEPRHRVEVAVRSWRPEGPAGASQWPSSVDAATIAGPGAAWLPAAATIEVIGGEDIAALAYGDHITLEASLSRVRGERAVAIGWDGRVGTTRPATGTAGAIANIREKFREATDGLPAPVRGLSRGMVIGDTRSMPSQQRDDMRVSGLTHLTAVSGAHFAVVAVLLHGVLRRLRLGRATRAVVAAVGMGAFALLVFPDASVVRALVMALVGALAILWGRPAHGLPALATAVIALVWVDPFVALEPGFALSVSAVAAIILWAPRLRVLLERVVSPTPALLLSVPLAAQAACAPILILLEPRVSLYAVGANLLAAPLAAPVTLTGLGAVIIGPVSHSVATFAAWLASLPAWPVAVVASAAASLPGSTVSWPQGIAGALSLAALTAAGMWWTVARGPRLLKTLATLVALIAIMVTAKADRVWEWTSPVPGEWAVVACDVGQGDMMMLRVDQHSAVLIDAGPGDGTAAACLRRFGVSRVPLLILTHPHADHDGGVAEVLAAARVDTAWVPHLATVNGLDEAAEMMRRGGVSVEVPRPGASWRAAQVDVTLRLASPAASAPAPAPRADGELWASQLDGTDLNDASLVVSGITQGVSFLALGDVETEAQRDLETTIEGTLAVDVVKIPHHGSRVQEAGLAARIEAAVAVVSVGAANNYGHPSREALELYGRGGTRVIRTDECADVVVWREDGLRVASGCQ